LTGGAGAEFDLGALTRSPSAAARIPLFLFALLIVRGAPAVLYAPTVGRRGAVAAGLLQATSLPVIVIAASIGVAIHAIAPVTASALVATGLLSVLAFPLIALVVIRAAEPIHNHLPKKDDHACLCRHRGHGRPIRPGMLPGAEGQKTSSTPTRRELHLERKISYP
jgi:Kef-type K+ transport system membrane component KefB